MRGFNYNSGNLPDNVKKLMRPEDRKALGKAGLTNEEAMQRAEVKTERQLQNLIDSLLRLKGIVPIRSRMDTATTNNVGCPDFLFAIFNQYDDSTIPEKVAFAWEVKLPGKELDNDQKCIKTDMTHVPNAWMHQVIHSVDEAITALKRIGIK